MLDKFRETAITWDKANRKIYEPLRVSAGDNKGRKLSVQVVNGGVIEDLSGASLSLFWETKDKAHKGLDAFSAVDATKGEFEIYYTTGMLSNEGILTANLVLVDTSGRIVSEPFTITVFKGIDDDAIQSSDSFTALTEALVQVGTINNKADRDELLALESTFEQNKVSVEQQLQQIGVSVTSFGILGDGSDETEKFITMVNSGYSHFVIPDNFTIFIKPTNLIPISSLFLRGGTNSKIISDGNSNLFDISNALHVSNVIFEDINKIQETDTESGQLLSIIIDNCSFKNVKKPFHIKGEGGFRTFEITNSYAEEFYMFTYHTCIIQENVNFDGNIFIGTLDFEPTRERNIGQTCVYYSTQVVDEGVAIFKNNTVKNLLTSNHRADCFLSRVGLMVAKNNIIENILPNLTYRVNKFMSKETIGEDTGSGLYSSSKKTIFSGNVIKNVGRNAIANTSYCVDFIARDNTISFDLDDIPSRVDWYVWGLNGFYDRSINSTIENNDIVNYPIPINNYKPALLRGLKESGNRKLHVLTNNIYNEEIRPNVRGGWGRSIWVEGINKNILIKNNVIKGLDNSHPDSRLDQIAYISYLIDNAIDEAYDNVVFDSNIFKKMENTRLATRDSPIMITTSDGVVEMEQFSVIDNVCDEVDSGYFIDLRNISTKGFIFDRNDVNGNIFFGSNAHTDFYYGVNFEKGKKGGYFTLSTIIEPEIGFRDIVIPNSIMQSKLLVEPQTVDISLTTKMVETTHIYVNNYSTSGFTVNANVPPTENFRMQVTIDFSGRRYNVLAA